MTMETMTEGWLSDEYEPEVEVENTLEALYEMQEMKDRNSGSIEAYLETQHAMVHNAKEQYDKETAHELLERFQYDIDWAIETAQELRGDQ